MRKSDQEINISLKKQIREILSQAITDLRDRTETDKFLSDFFTESEYETLARRLAIAYWLKKGRTYTNIKDNLRVSSATIASVQGEMTKPGFQLILKKVEAEEWANQWSEKIKNFVDK